MTAHAVRSAVPTTSATITTTTRKTLWRWGIALIGCAAVLFAASVVLFEGARETTNIVHDRAMQAVINVTGARQALVTADTDAMNAFQMGENQVADAENEYQGQIALASQDLEQVAENNQAGVRGSQTLQLVTGELGIYSGMVEHAHADLVSGATPLATAEIRYASDFMRRQDIDGLVPELDGLYMAEWNALHDEQSSFWTTPWTVLIWGLPALALLVLLIRVQGYLRRRFRRQYNWPLATASFLLLVGLVAGTTLVLTADRGLSAAETTFDQVETANQNQLPNTVDKSGLDAAGSKQVYATSVDLDLEIGISSAALIIAGLVVVGLWPRINEYRYQT